jgi:LPS export ABC transporter permease LptG/LPS export ABC transporter permease LptF
MVKYVDRYVLKELFPPFFLGLGIFSFVLLMNELLKAPERFIADGVPLGVTLKLFLYLVPAILAFTVPMSVLMGILAGLSRMSSDSEIIALKTLGIGPVRTLRPVLLFSFGGWVLTTVLAGFLAPVFNYKWIQTFASAVLNKVELQIGARDFNESVANMVLFIENVDRDRGWEDVFLHFSDTPNEPRILMAKSGRLHVYPEAKRAVLELHDAVQHSCALDDPVNYRVWSVKTIEEEIEAESLFASLTPEKRVREKQFQELLAGLKDAGKHLPALRRDWLDMQRRRLRPPDFRFIESREAVNRAEHARLSYLVEIHKKIALPFVCWIFAFLGVPLGSWTKKGGRTSGFTLSIIIILIYYIFITAGEKMAMDGRVTPFLGMWAGDIVFGLFALALFAASAREVPFLARLARRWRGPATAAAAPAKRTRKFRLPRLSLAFPNILDRYIMRRYLFIATLIFSSLISISIIVTAFDRIDRVYEHHKPISMLLAYLLNRIPEFVHLSLPVTALMGVLLTLGIFTKTNELTAMKACGISVFRAIVPLVVLSLVVGALALYNQENVLPPSNIKADETWSAIMDAPPKSYSYELRRWVANKSGDRFYHYDYFDPTTSTFHRLSVFDLDIPNWSISRRVYAEKALLQGDSLVLKNGWLREFNGDAPGKFERNDVMVLPLSEDKKFFLEESKEPGQMNLGELRSYIGEVRDMGFDTLHLRVDLSAKASFPFVALVMTLVGIPFAFSMGKRGALVGIGAGVVLSVVYWVMIGIFLGLGYAQLLSPFLAAWGPNLIFGLIGLVLLLRLRT